MNRLAGIITNFHSVDTMSTVNVNTEIGEFCCVILENPQTATYLKKENKVKLLFKETNFFISKNQIYNFNSFRTIIKDILLADIFVKLAVESNNYFFCVLITKKEFETFDLNLNDEIFVYIKPTNIILEI
ncbi:hypothetical protein [Calditerrivibrio nitroreducens]|uniref:hypothetical protein n=1 Tax=Calditerrivibrio nitroreducens TaxID=477976 RepID=UPI003C74A172